jgi:hypothetical protein
MTMSDHNGRDPIETGRLEAAFAKLRGDAPQPSDALLARVLADADAETAVRARAGDAPASRSPWHSRWRALAALLGGVQGIAGLATAALAGLWIGAFPPAPVIALEQALLGTPVLVQFDADPLFDLDD